ncbi:protein-tyrosine sulfotransferase [Pseudoalteromonas sp. BMB]|uniref:tetratricopeptide repeat-containing sulfotransferase family protein n=1 Tax=Pseudoalteromonas sp. BMB TaxID=1874619 RepID=UPI00083DF9A1|nr:sulfotransferase [Pseudoalteromonas sp. BMB]ODB33254.1 protein-tyrosine sulfotransferase [Pseudoalteromonas sp. BMB]
MLLLKRANELLAENKLREAEFMYKSVLKQSPNNGPALFGLGRICMRLEQYDNAIYYLKRACEHLPKMLEPLFALADAFLAVGSPVDAKTVLEYTLSVAKHNAQAHYQLGQFYLDYGFIEQAKNVFKAGLDCPHSTVTAFMLYELVQMSSAKELPAYLTILEKLENEFEAPRLKTVVHYALAKCHEQLGNFNAAQDNYALANDTQLLMSEFRTVDMLPFFESIKQHCGKTFFDKPSDRVKTTFTPVFIVGLPRTGSTLLEQMLVQHSHVGTLGENTVISDKIVPYLSKRNNAEFPACLDQLSNSMLDHCRILYVDEIKRHRVPEEVVINKLPANFQNLGLIHKLFPEARIIHLTRNLNATAWSVYSNHFAESEPYFCSLSEFALYAQAQSDLMSHFNQFMKRDIFTLSYEQLIAEPEKSLKQCLSFLYQKYEPECLEFHKSKKPVHTLSKAQVRKPISTQPLEKWQRYEAFIEKMIAQPQSDQTTPANL